MNDQPKFDQNDLSKFLYKILKKWTDYDETIEKEFMKEVQKDNSQWRGESAFILVDKNKHKGKLSFELYTVY
jgi:hypothetical protein